MCSRQRTEAGAAPAILGLMKLHQMHPPRNRQMVEEAPTRMMRDTVRRTTLASPPRLEAGAAAEQEEAVLAKAQSCFLRLLPSLQAALAPGAGTAPLARQGEEQAEHPTAHWEKHSPGGCRSTNLPPRLGSHARTDQALLTRHLLLLLLLRQCRIPVAMADGLTIALVLDSWQARDPSGD